MIIPRPEEIKERREKLGFLRSELSRRAGLPDNAILRIERGDTKYTYPIRARAIADALGCELEDVFIVK